MTTTPHSENKLLVAMELSNSKWLLAFSNGEKIRRKSIDARDRARFMQEVKLVKEKLGLDSASPVLCCYEAGRDGFWIYRWLKQVGLECLVIDPARIEVNRRKRRAKTDRLDAEAMVRLLGRYAGGETKIWAVVRVPSEEQEDGLRLHRELERLKKERTGHLNRIKALFILHGIKLSGTLTKLSKTLDTVQCWNKKPLAEELKEEVRRELERLRLVGEQITKLEKSKAEALKNPRTNAEHQAKQTRRRHGVTQTRGQVSTFNIDSGTRGHGTRGTRGDTGSGLNFQHGDTGSGLNFQY